MSEIAKKVNPRKIPKTQEDVDRAWEKGVADGVSNACAIFLTVLLDKFNGGEHIGAVWSEINKLSGEIKERRVSIADLRNTLLEEYSIEV